MYWLIVGAVIGVLFLGWSIYLKRLRAQGYWVRANSWDLPVTLAILIILGAIAIPRLRAAMEEHRAAEVEAVEAVESDSAEVEADTASRP